MKALKAFLKINIGMLLFCFVLIGNIPHTYASPQMTMHQHTPYPSSNCQTRCANNTIAVLTTKPDEQEEKKDDPEPNIPETLIGSTILLDKVSDKKTRASTDARILRPPDLIVLNCIYRI